MPVTAIYHILNCGESKLDSSESSHLQDHGADSDTRAAASTAEEEGGDDKEAHHRLALGVHARIGHSEVVADPFVGHVSFKG
jgi:hypothetical protein